jgi:outer membrane protein insertion porin family
MSKHKITLIFIFLLLLSFSLSYSQELTITSVDVEGNLTVDKSLIINMSGLSVGAKLDLSLIQDVIQKIYAMGYFSDVQIKGEETPDGEKILIVVREYPKLKTVEFSGNKKIKAQDLKEKLKIAVGGLISPSKVKEEMENIKSLYDDKGYLRAIVSSQVIQTETPGEVILKFNIEEGKKVKIKRIYVGGNLALADKKIKKQMKNKEDSFFRSGEFKPEKFEEDKEKIVEFYKKEGYLDAEVVSDSIWYDPSFKDMFIKLSLFEGERYSFGQVRWEGNKLFSEDKLKSYVRFKEGQIYNQEKYEKTLQDLYSLYMEEGYIYARILDNITTKSNAVNINYQISEGVPANINKINIEGNTKTKEKVIRRELSVKPSQRFRRSLLMRSVRDVMYLNYFANVVPDYQVLDNGDIDLVLKIEEKPTGQMSVGAGYSESDKLVGTIGLGTPNLFGNGQTLQLSWDFGKTKQSIQLSFTEPWFRDTHTSVGVDIYNVNRTWYDNYFTEERKGFDLRLGRRLSWPDNYFSLFARYRLEDVRYYDFLTETDSTGEHIASSLKYLSDIDWPQRTSSIDFTITRDSRDLSQFATTGSVLSWNSEFAGGVLGGDWSYHKHVFQAGRYLKTFWKFVLVGKAKFGIIDALGKNGSLPYSERFSPGGVDPDGVIRGYSDGTVGPKDEEGSLLRGRSEVVYNLEYQFPVVEQQIYGLLFADMGGAWLSGKAAQPLSFRNLYKSLGFGVRIMVPSVGLIGFDMGYGFDYPNPQHRTHGEWKPHFNLGTTF